MAERRRDVKVERERERERERVGVDEVAGLYCTIWNSYRIALATRDDFFVIERSKCG